MYDIELSIFPASDPTTQQILFSSAQRSSVPDTEEESEDVRLLFFVQLTDVLVGTHSSAL